MFVGNHSGFGVMEVFVLLTSWYRHFGFDRPVAGLCHDIGFWPPFRWVVLPIGGIRARRDEALRALNRKIDILVFPGGDHDALRPFGLRYAICWGNRSGFIDLAAQAGVPIVPFVNCGSHAQYTVLPGGRLIARLLGLRKIRLERWGIPLGACAFLGALLAWLLGGLSGAWVWLALGIAVFPNPTRMQIRFLTPIDPRDSLERYASPQAAAEALRQDMEQKLRLLSKERMTPWF